MPADIGCVDVVRVAAGIFERRHGHRGEETMGERTALHRCDLAVGVPRKLELCELHREGMVLLVITAELLVP